ncbi:hypothetical protein ACFQ2M_35955 [Kitasatospora saccharophila]|uniref:hypothetical protein n=1 Tax=Kitasatospora saccharophila TaxID=407973 RepID=UPI00363B8DC3
MVQRQQCSLAREFTRREQVLRADEAQRQITEAGDRARPVQAAAAASSARSAAAAAATASACRSAITATPSPCRRTQAATGCSASTAEVSSTRIEPWCATSRVVPGAAPAGSLSVKPQSSRSRAAYLWASSTYSSVYAMPGTVMRSLRGAWP